MAVEMAVGDTPGCLPLTHGSLTLAVLPSAPQCQPGPPPAVSEESLRSPTRFDMVSKPSLPAGNASKAPHKPEALAKGPLDGAAGLGGNDLFVVPVSVGWFIWGISPDSGSLFDHSVNCHFG